MLIGYKKDILTFNGLEVVPDKSSQIQLFLVALLTCTSPYVQGHFIYATTSVGCKASLSHLKTVSRPSLMRSIPKLQLLLLYTHQNKITVHLVSLEKHIVSVVMAGILDFVFSETCYNDKIACNPLKTNLIPTAQSKFTR